MTIQWHKDLLDEKLLRRNQLSFIRKMFDLSLKGILFSKETIQHIYPRIVSLDKESGFDSVMALIDILHDLSTSRNMRTLSETGFNSDYQSNFNSRRIEKAFEYMNKNYDKPITLGDIAKLVNMTEVSFSRFIKKRTGITFIDSLNVTKKAGQTRLFLRLPLTVSAYCLFTGNPRLIISASTCGSRPRKLR